MPLTISARKSSAVRHRVVQELHARHIGIAARKTLEARLETFLARDAADLLGQVRERALRLLQREQAKLEEAVARLQRQEVRIAATGIEHDALRVALGELDQHILQLERAQLAEGFEFLGLHRRVGRHGGFP
jgi:hypothetical protein